MSEIVVRIPHFYGSVFYTINGYARPGLYLQALRTFSNGAHMPVRGVPIVNISWRRHELSNIVYKVETYSSIISS